MPSSSYDTPPALPTTIAAWVGFYCFTVAHPLSCRLCRVPTAILGTTGVCELGWCFLKIHSEPALEPLPLQSHFHSRAMAEGRAKMHQWPNLCPKLNLLWAFWHQVRKSSCNSLQSYSGQGKAKDNAGPTGKQNVTHFYCAFGISEEARILSSVLKWFLVCCMSPEGTVPLLLFSSDGNNVCFTSFRFNR